MGTRDAIAERSAGRRSATWLGAILLAAGGVGHLLAARAIGGSYIAYRDHIVGFVGLSVVFGGVLAALGSRYWRGRGDLTLLMLGVSQAIIGAVIYSLRFHIT